MDVEGLLFVSNSGQSWNYFDSKKEVSTFEFSNNEFRAKNMKSNLILLDVELSSTDKCFESSNNFCQFWYRNQIFGAYFVKVSDALKFKQLFKKGLEFAKEKETKNSDPPLPPPLKIHDKNLSQKSTSSKISIVHSTKEPTMSSNSSPPECKASEFDLKHQQNVSVLSKKLAASFGANVISGKHKCVTESEEISNNQSNSRSSALKESVTLNKDINKNFLAATPPRVPQRFESIKKVNTPRNQSNVTLRDALAIAINTNSQNCNQSVPTTVQTRMEVTKPKNEVSQAQINESLEMIDLISGRKTNCEDKNCGNIKIYFNNQENHHDTINNAKSNISSFTKKNPDPKVKHDTPEFDSPSAQNNVSNLNVKKVLNQNQDKVSENESFSTPENLQETFPDSSIITRGDLDYLQMKILAFIREEFDKLNLRLSR